MSQSIFPLIVLMFQSRLDLDLHLNLQQIIRLLIKSNLIKLIAKSNKLMKLVIIKNVGLTYLRGLKIAELKEEGIPTKLLVLL
jgi:hypothetical protein